MWSPDSAPGGSSNVRATNPTGNEPKQYRHPRCLDRARSDVGAHRMRAARCFADRPRALQRDNAPGHTALIIDLDLARVAASDDSVTQTGMVIGTPAYMGPSKFGRIGRHSHRHLLPRTDNHRMRRTGAPRAGRPVSDGPVGPRERQPRARFAWPRGRHSACRRQPGLFEYEIGFPERDLGWLHAGGPVEQHLFGTGVVSAGRQCCRMDGMRATRRYGG